MQSKPMSYTEIRDEHGSWTLKLVWQRAIRKEMPHLLFLKNIYVYCPLYSTRITVFDFSRCVFEEKKEKRSVLFDLWAVMCNTNLYD